MFYFHSVSPVKAAVLHTVIRVAGTVLDTSPASACSVRLPAGRPATKVTGGRLTSAQCSVLVLRTSPLSCWRCSCRQTEKNRIRAPDVVAESADTIPGPKDTDVAHTKSEGKILQIFPAIKDGVLQVPPVVGGG